VLTAGRDGGGAGIGCRGPEIIWPGRGGIEGAVGAGFAGIAIVRCGIAGEGGGAAGAGAGGGATGASLGAGGVAMTPASGGRNGTDGRGAAATGPAAGFSASGSVAAGAAAGAASAGAALCRLGGASSSLTCVSAIVSSSAYVATAVPKSCSLPEPSPTSCPSLCRIFKATSSSIELECVFFSATPSSGNRSMILCGLTSNSRASSLIRILLICWLCELLSVTVLPIARIGGTARG